MIVSIRGTHGSGKTTVVKNLLSRYKAQPVGGSNKPDGYVFHWSKVIRPIYVVGSYKTACGGCDGIQPYALIWPRIVDYAERGHVLFEGALVSSSYGNIGRASEVYGDEVVFAFLDTPLEECLRRIALRRAAKGVTKPLDPRNTTTKYLNVQRSIAKIRDDFGRRVVILDHTNAVEQVLELLRKADSSEPTVDSVRVRPGVAQGRRS